MKARYYAAILLAIILCLPLLSSAAWQAKHSTNTATPTLKEAEIAVRSGAQQVVFLGNSTAHAPARFAMGGYTSLGGNRAVCWKTTGKLGYCSTQPDSTGACTCN